MTRGGARAGAGRPAKDTVIYYRRVKPEWVEELDKKLQELKGGNDMILTDEQKDLIFYVLAGFQQGLYWDDEFNEIECITNQVDFQMNDMPQKASLREFTKLVEKTMDMMCH